jgi:hypothetical protein
MLVFAIACFSFTVSQEIRGYLISAEKPASISVGAVSFIRYCRTINYCGMDERAGRPLMPRRSQLTRSTSRARATREYKFLKKLTMDYRALRRVRGSFSEIRKTGGEFSQSCKDELLIRRSPSFR